MSIPFHVHDATTFRRLRPAHITEVRRASAQWGFGERFFSDDTGRAVFFPLYINHDLDDVRRWLERNDGAEGASA